MMLRGNNSMAFEIVWKWHCELHEVHKIYDEGGMTQSRLYENVKQIDKELLENMRDGLIECCHYSLKEMELGEKYGLVRDLNNYFWTVDKS